jgi:uncharacterized protein with HEPN domain
LLDDARAFKKASLPSQNANLGNFLRHEYRDVDPELIWNITQENLSTLVEAARKLVGMLRGSVPA